MSIRIESPAQPERRGSPSEPSRVDLVDDDASVRRSLNRLLRAAGYDARAYADAAAFLAAVGTCGPPSCLLVDLRLPGASGLDLQQELRERGLETPLVFISGRADVRSGIDALKGGAVDFLEKPFTDEALLGAVARAVEQDRRRRAWLADRARLAGRLETLTPREREVFSLVVTGLLNKQVGAEIGTTEKTVKVHRARVMQKMGAGSLAQLVRMADRLRPLEAADRPVCEPDDSSAEAEVWRPAAGQGRGVI
ncbi:MAG TPA: response regulator [Vicinamibacteria bacterium]|nr:response regulator [Vicinamibacteria bacterium]